MSTYNLSDNVQDSFNFELRGLKYTVRYPRIEEVENIQELTQKAQEAQEEKRLDDAKSIGEKLETIMYEFITPEGHETPIKDALAKENIKVLRNFNTMIRTELSIQ